MMPPGMAMGSLGALTAGRAPVGLLGHAAAGRRAAAGAHGRARLDSAAAAGLPAAATFEYLLHGVDPLPPEPPGYPPIILHEVMCDDAASLGPLILHLTPRLRGRTPSPRRRLDGVDANAPCPPISSAGLDPA